MAAGHVQVGIEEWGPGAWDEHAKRTDPGPSSHLVIECWTTAYPPAYLGRTGAYCVYAVDWRTDRTAGQGTATHSIDNRERTLNPRVQGSSPWGRTDEAAGQAAFHLLEVAPAKSCQRGRNLIPRRSGRIGRSAAGRALDPGAITLAVVASVRHLDTPYDALDVGSPRADARAQLIRSGRGCAGLLVGRGRPMRGGLRHDALCRLSCRSTLTSQRTPYTVPVRCFVRSPSEEPHVDKVRAGRGTAFRRGAGTDRACRAIRGTVSVLVHRGGSGGAG